MVDDGVGLPTGELPHGNGIRNMTARAERLGGTFELRPAPSTGTILEWRVPVR